MISPDTAPRGMPRGAVVHRVEEELLPEHARLARADPREPFGIEQLETEREVIDAEIDQPVVAGEVLLGRQLHADEQPDVLLDRADVGLGVAQAARSLEAAVEVHERNARFLARGVARLDDVVHGLDRRFGAADVRAGRAEAAVERRTVVPERAHRIDVDPEVGALQHADARHRHVARGLTAVPGGLAAAARPGSARAPRRRGWRSRTPGCPAARTATARTNGSTTGAFIQMSPLQPRVRGDHDLETGSEPRARARDPARAFERHVRRHAQAAAEQIDLELAGVERRIFQVIARGMPRVKPGASRTGCRIPGTRYAVPRATSASVPALTSRAPRPGPRPRR